MLWSSYNTRLSAKTTKGSNSGPVNEQISNYLNNDNLFFNFSLGKKAENSCFLADTFVFSVLAEFTIHGQVCIKIVKFVPFANIGPVFTHIGQVCHSHGIDILPHKHTI